MTNRKRMGITHCDESSPYISVVPQENKSLLNFPECALEAVGELVF